MDGDRPTLTRHISEYCYDSCMRILASIVRDNTRAGRRDLRPGVLDNVIGSIDRNATIPARGAYVCVHGHVRACIWITNRCDGYISTTGFDNTITDGQRAAGANSNTTARSTNADNIINLGDDQTALILHINAARIGRLRCQLDNLCLDGRFRTTQALRCLE